MYDPINKRVHISRDVVFDESSQWDWSSDSAESGNFTIEYLVMSSRIGPDIPAEIEPEGGEVDELEGAGSPPGWHVEVDQVAGTLDQEVQELDDHIDVDHDDAPLRLRSVDSILGQAAVPGHAMRNLGQEQLFAISAKEPTSMADAERQPS
jgi:hypothetical protein